jgi:tetratricopeptide (TPR) repeat protein
MASREKSAAEWLHEGRRWVEEGVYDAALECGQRALAQSPEDPEILYFLGKISEDVERPASARRYFEQIVAVDPAWNDGAASRALEQVHGELKNAEEGLATCQAWPCDEMFFSGALWLRQLGQLDEALSNLDDAASCGWDREDVLHEMGEVHLELGDFQSAADCFGEALEIDPKLAHAWYGHAAALRKLGRFREALSSIERSLELHPTAADRWLRDEILAALEASGVEP